MDVFFRLFIFSPTVITSFSIFPRITSIICCSISKFCINITHSIVFYSFFIRFNLGNFVKEKHEVDEESNDQGIKLDLKKVSCQEACKFLHICSNINGGSGTSSRSSLFLLCLFSSNHCSFNLCCKLLFFSLLFSNLLQIFLDSQ